MVSAVSRLNYQNFNPDFFAYGQFPLYLTFFTTPNHLTNAIPLTLRFWSAVFSSFSVLFFYLIGKKIFKSKRFAFIFSLFLIFTSGLIQLAHFGTTESILIFVFAANIYLSFLFYDNPKKINLLFFTGLISGIGIATKISALIFITPICFSFLFLFLKSPKQILNLFFKFLFFVFIVCIFSVLFSPYNLLDYPKFLSSMKYEIGVANGSIPVFYTRQFIGSFPYIFQFQKIFPYANGIFIFGFGFIGFGFIFRKFLRVKKILIY
jgi:dolichyl-phosphate-mannose--protein O-mannosyl transferase